jgi:hypothetical protein
MLPLIAALAALQAAPAPAPAPAANPNDPESRCAYIIRDAAGIHPGEDPNLHVLAQTAADAPFAPVKPAGAVGIQCWRASIIPGAHDEKVILAHLALIIAETTGASPHRIGALGYDGTHFTFIMRVGTLTPAEQTQVDARLAEYLARIHPNAAH